MDMSYYHLRDKLLGLNSAYCPLSERELLIEPYVAALPTIMNSMSVSQIKQFKYYFSPPNVDNLEKFEAGLIEAEKLVLEKSTFGKKKIL